MSTVAGDEATPRGQTSPWMRRVYDRKLDVYPDTRRRSMYLAVTVLATIVLYYEFYVQGAVSTQIIQHFGFSFTGFVFVQVIGSAVGAFASLAAGLADRVGRANLVVVGTLVTALLILFALPGASSQVEYTVFFSMLALVDGVCLVATPALIRDFSPPGQARDLDGVLDDGTGARQSRRDRGLKPHARQPPGLAVPVPAVRDRRARRVGDHVRAAA